MSELPKRWKMGDVHPETGMVFTQYDKIRGERWADPEVFKARLQRKNEREKQKYREDPEFREKRLADGKVRSKTPENKEKERKRSRQRRKCPTYQEWHRQYGKRWYKKNAETQRPKNAAGLRERRKTDPLFDLADRYRRSLNNGIKKKGVREYRRPRSTHALGCTWEELFIYIENQFVDGMTWDNRHLWEIDHIYPLRLAKTPEDVVRLCHHTNLQPLWREDNRKKAGKLPHEYPITK